MTSGWATERKTSLTPHEALMVAHAHLIGGIEQQQLASMYAINIGRINEACTIMRWAAENHRQLHNDREKQRA